MKFSKITLAAGMIGLTALAACSEKVQSMDGSYRLVALDDKATLVNPTLKIEGKRVSGTGACNNFSGENKAEWPQVALSPLATTRKACFENAALEQTYFTALDQASSAELTQNGIVLSGPGHKLQFTRE
ncbi:MAG: META domain-containing protein [Paracoccus sp. (in: a-proteobacteria)]